MKCKGSKRKGALLHCSTVTTNVSESVYLLVRNVSGADSGAFECVANNGVGQEAKNTSFLLVRGESVIVQAISLILELFFYGKLPIEKQCNEKGVLSKRCLLCFTPNVLARPLPCLSSLRQVVYEIFLH